MKTEQDLTDLFMRDSELMQILHTVSSLELPDWWVCAGYIRAKVWDRLHEYAAPTKTDDVDVIYFDPSETDESREKYYEATLHRLQPNVPWSVKNQARMHIINHLPPYTSSIDALSKFPETVTAIGVRLEESRTLKLAAPHGVDDLIELQVRPTPTFRCESRHHQIYLERIKQKNWSETWPLVVHTE